MVPSGCPGGWPGCSGLTGQILVAGRWWTHRDEELSIAIVGLPQANIRNKAF